eukprot:365652-Chlamydomonas_euryale.AAC.8
MRAYVSACLRSCARVQGRVRVCAAVRAHARAGACRGGVQGRQGQDVGLAHSTECGLAHSTECGRVCPHLQSVAGACAAPGALVEAPLQLKVRSAAPSIPSSLGVAGSVDGCSRYSACRGAGGLDVGIGRREYVGMRVWDGWCVIQGEACRVGQSRLRQTAYGAVLYFCKTVLVHEQLCANLDQLMNGWMESWMGGCAWMNV